MTAGTSNIVSGLGAHRENDQGERSGRDEGMAWGAAAYSLGVILEFLRWPNVFSGIVGPHELFHLFVLAGVSWHWRFVRNCVAKNLASRDQPGGTIPTVK
ncbi:MAG TPA: hypothetical protein VH643_22225 [Gemmataceae bacterium]|jgi:hypothetical protein